MGKRTLTACAAAAVLLAACIPSVNPFYTEKDVVMDQRLLGGWQEKGNADNPDVWQFERSTNGNSFNLTITENGRTGEFSAHLFKLKTEEFLDLIPTDCDYATNQADLVAVSMFPGHLLVHVPQIEPALKLEFFNFDWLEKYLEKNPGALEHHREGERIVLTADTRALQNFVLKHLGTNELFKASDSDGEMVRRPSADKPADGAK
ncbi:MAG TPA: hypothetical protein VG938_12785 [Verrucomicrobiae bacterium]|jgi:hypothetical protein|nr:hypothetical protein [Verrucomicrobiae bacterium]